MALKEMPKVGDEVRYLGGDDDGDAMVLDDNGDNWYLLESENFDYYELVTEPQPDVADLIANLGRRLSEVETALMPKVGVADKPAQIRAVCDKVRDLLIRKNHDYGDSFAQQYEKYGLQSALIRMDDKMRRLETLADGEQAQVAESIEDTLMDLAGYALLALVEAGEAE